MDTYTNLALVVFGFGSQAFVCGFSRQNINSVNEWPIYGLSIAQYGDLLKIQNQR